MGTVVGAPAEQFDARGFDLIRDLEGVGTVATGPADQTAVVDFLVVLRDRMLGVLFEFVDPLGRRAVEVDDGLVAVVVEVDRVLQSVRRRADPVGVGVDQDSELFRHGTDSYTVGQNG